MVQPLDFLERQWRRHGDLFSIKYPMFDRIAYVVDPEAVGRIFTGDPHRFHAGEGNMGPLGPVVGDNSLLTLDGDAHMEQRRLLLPPFHGDRIRRYEEVMVEAAERELAGWPLGRPFALRPAMQRITLEVILRAVFGVREEARLARFRQLIPQFGASSNAIVWVPALRRDLGRFSPWRRFLRRREELDALIYDEIRERRAGADSESRDDVLSLLLSARHEDGSPMSDVELRDELMTVLAAGHETTATGLAWVFERVLRHPEVHRLLREAVDRDGGGDYVDAVIKETLRVRPVVVDVVRKLTADTEIMGRTLPAGTFVVPAVALVHLRPDVYPDPRAFRPERFLDGAPAPYTWIPFGGGVRRCIGASFAQYEMATVLRTLISRVRLRAASSRPEPPRTRNVTIVPSRGCRVVVDELLG
ncbi:MAG: cytochrome family [Thermoleophilaceae bacterium]|nr:cytochrome family [Thermoleophilaceae bacterium]